jgi:uncharacterized protein YcnI
MNKRFIFVGLVVAVIFSVVSIASAHVTVKPAEVNIGTFQTFSISVPVERDIPTIAVRVVLPQGLEHVTPNVKPGWKIAKTDTEISWTGGSIPAGQRDEFVFSAKVPSQETTLVWKAYQTYQGGAVVAWDLQADQQPKSTDGKDDFSKSGPYSQTKVINDLKAARVTTENKASGTSSPAMVFSIVALVFSIIALGASRRKVQ